MVKAASQDEGNEAPSDEDRLTTDSPAKRPHDADDDERDYKVSKHEGAITDDADRSVCGRPAPSACRAWNQGVEETHRAIPFKLNDGVSDRDLEHGATG